MKHLFSSGLVADVALAMIAAEAVAIGWLGRRGRGPGLAAVAPFLAAGACLMLALRAALVSAPWPYVAVALAASGVAHVVDLMRRLRA